MRIDEILLLIQPYIDEPIINFQIDRKLFEEDKWRKEFNKEIKKRVGPKYGIYVWVNSATEEVVYIGMAGRIKTDGSLGQHTLQKRLTASRGKDKETKKYIVTNDYVRNFMNNNNIHSLDFFIMHSRPEEPPAYIESLLLYHFYKKHKRLPILNFEF